MLEQATQFSTTTQPDTGYKSWQASVGKAVMRHQIDARTAAPVPSFGRMVHENVMTAQSYAPNPSQPSTNGTAKPDIAYSQTDNSNEYTFADVLDVINPLQHLPVIGTIYRKLTGDTIKPMSDIVGGAIFGGPIGAVASTANVVVKSTTGRDIAENAFALAGFDVTPEPNKPMIAYEKAAALAPSGNLFTTNLIEIESASGTFHAVATDGRRNFAAREIPAQTWNA
jgi:hypothetical protein